MTSKADLWDMYNRAQDRANQAHQDKVAVLTNIARVFGLNDRYMTTAEKWVRKPVVSNGRTVFIDDMEQYQYFDILKLEEDLKLAVQGFEAAEAMERLLGNDEF